jgi:protein-L-isoaspartate(D-aspartate) O-methyltransferase
MEDEAFFTSERQRMVQEQLIERGIRDKRLLEAMRLIPRHLFVLPEHQHLAYSDGPLPIGSGQTISQPYIVALMTQWLQLDGEENVLEVGTGSGYQAAILARLAHQVHTVERYADLAEKAAGTLQSLGLANARVHVGDGSLGLPELAPFQAIMVTAAAPEVPRTLLEQLDEGGRLILPVGGRMNQYLERWERIGKRFERDELVPVAFVPLRGKYGWNEERWEVY